MFLWYGADNGGGLHTLTLYLLQLSSVKEVYAQHFSRPQP